MGDLYVRISVNFPTHIDPNVIPLLEQALPARTQMVVPTGDKGQKLAVDEVTLEEPNDRQRRAAQNGDEMDEDDDERGGPGVQCAQRMCSSSLAGLGLQLGCILCSCARGFDVRAACLRI